MTVRSVVRPSGKHWLFPGVELPGTADGIRGRRTSRGRKCVELQAFEGFCPSIRPVDERK